MTDRRKRPVQPGKGERSASGEHPQEQESFIAYAEDLNCLFDYFEAALTGEESKAKLKQLWIQEVGVIRSRPASGQREPVWTDEEVMKEIEDAFDRGLEAAENTIDMQKHDAGVAAQARREVLDKATKRIDALSSTSGTFSGYVLLSAVHLVLESLRQGAGGAGK